MQPKCDMFYLFQCIKQNQNKSGMSNKKVEHVGIGLIRVLDRNKEKGGKYEFKKGNLNEKNIQKKLLDSFVVVVVLLLLLIHILILILLRISSTARSGALRMITSMLYVCVCGCVREKVCKR